MSIDKTFWRAIVLTIPITLAGCTDNRNDTKCSELYTSRLDAHDFEHLDGGITRHKSSGLVFTRCAVGQRLINFNCVGSSVKLNWDDAQSYVREIAEKSGERWRVPTRTEMLEIFESECINPAVNPYVFPNMEVANFWTSSQRMSPDAFRCSVYSYQGSVSCRQSRKVEQVFLMVRD